MPGGALGTAGLLVPGAPAPVAEAPGARVLAAQEAGKLVDPEGAANVWRGLIHGHWTIIDHCDREGRRFLLAVEGPCKAGQSSSLTPREARILARIALRQSLKLVSYELGVSHSTASGLLQSALRKLRLSSVAEAVRLFSSPAHARAEPFDP